MAITADGRYLFTSDDQDGDVKVFRVNDGRVIKLYRRLFDGGVMSLITTPDNKFLFAAGTYDVKQINVESKKVVHHYKGIHDEEIICMQTTGDSKYVLTGSFDRRVKRISVNDRAVEKDYGRVSDLYITAMTISADEKKLFLGDFGGNLKLISLKTGKTIKHFGIVHDWMSGIVITADEKSFFTSSRDGLFKQWNYGDRLLVRDYGETAPHIRCLCL